jgi:hypothetical protein
MKLKEKIFNIVDENIKREGIENLKYYVEHATDYFTAPSSTMYHGAHEGGLAEHSLNVYNTLKDKVSYFNIKDISEETLAICGLFHDICKTNFYKIGKRWTKESGVWEQVDSYMVEDTFPSGHGEKSVFILQRFLNLTDQEILAIRWHMMAFDASIHFNYPNGYPFKKSMKEVPLVCLLATSDLEASTLLEENK